jgi:hypothetical protein
MITDIVITLLLIEWKKNYRFLNGTNQHSTDMNETRTRDAENIYIRVQNDLLSG